MTLRDLAITVFVLGSLPLCFRRPFMGLLMFSLLAYMRIQDLAWGFARFERWSYYVAMVTLAGYVAARDRHGIIIEIRTMVLTFMAVFIGIGLLNAQGDLPVDWSPYFEYVKIIGIALFTTAVVRTRDHLRVLVWVIAMSFAFYGAKSGLQVVLSLGRMQIIQGPGGMIKDNNDFGLAVVMVIPMLLHLATSERREIFRRPLFLAIPLCMLTVMATHSRGAALSMGFMLGILVWRSRNRLLGISLGFVVLIVGVAVAPKSYTERLSTIQDYEEDGSAMGRINAWKVGWNMITGNPLFGVGLDRFQMNYLDYEPNKSIEQMQGGGTKVAHNSYVQIWAECGTPAFMAYLSLLFMSFVDIWLIRRLAKRRYHASWILSYCTMFEATLGAFMLGAVFLNRAHFDLFYHYVTIVLIFGRIARAEMRSPIRQTRRPSPIGGPLVRVPSRGFGNQPRLAPGFRTTALLPHGKG